jgi:hypothetical protein
VQAANKLRKEENAAFRKVVQAYREAGPAVAARVRLFLEQEHWQCESLLAAMIGTGMKARLSATLPADEIERMWQNERYAVSLSALAVEAQDGQINLAYRNHVGQTHSVKKIKRHFESAIQKEHPEIKVEWLRKTPPARVNQPQTLQLPI